MAVCVLAIWGIPAEAQERAPSPLPAIELKLEPASANGVFKSGAPIRMRAQLEGTSGKARTGRVIWTLATDGRKPLQQMESSCAVPGEHDQRVRAWLRVKLKVE